MNLCKLTNLMTGVLLLALPQLAAAVDDEKALAACSEAFIERLATTFGPAKYRFVPPREAAPDYTGLVGLQRQSTEYLLTATRASTGEVIARMECTADRSGDPVAITYLPIDREYAATARESERRSL